MTLSSRGGRGFSRGLPGRARALLLASPIASMAASIFGVALTLAPLATYKGFTVTGEVSLLRSILSVYGRGFNLQALLSISIITLLVDLGFLLSLALSAYALLQQLKSPSRGMSSLEAAPASALVAVLMFTLLLSILRVAVADVLPAIPVGTCYETTAGKLCFHPATVHYGLPYYMYWRHRLILIAIPLALAVLGVASALLLRRTPESPSR